MDRPRITKAEPAIFSVSVDVELVLTGTNLDQSTLWLQLRDTALAAAVAKDSETFKATFHSPNTAKFLIPKNTINVTATKYQIMLAKVTQETTEPLREDWRSHKDWPKISIYNVSSLMQTTVPTKGNETCSIGLYNAPDQVKAATITLTSRDLSKYTKKIAKTKEVAETEEIEETKKIAEAVTLIVNGWVQVANPVSREGHVHFVVPNLPSEGLYDVSLSLSLEEPHSTSPAVAIPGPPLIGYQPVFGSTTSIDSPTVPAMAINCSFSTEPLSPGSQFHQNIPQSPPRWVQAYSNSDVAGAGDKFDWIAYKNGALFIDMQPTKLIDDSNIDVQLLYLGSYGRIASGSPVALRVYTHGKGWRCARQQSNASILQGKEAPKQWIVDDNSKEYPTLRDEIFGIFQLIANEKYKIGDDAANFLARPSPCIIEASKPNGIMFGIDKVAIIPGTFTEPVDASYVDPKIAPIYLSSCSQPNQELVYGYGGFIDGIKVNGSANLVYMTAYIDYRPPKALSVVPSSMTTAPNAIEDVACSCIGSGTLVDQNDPSTKYLLTIASAPLNSSRPSNIFYSLYYGPGNGAVPSRTEWKPLMSYSVARSISLANGQVHVIQISNKNEILLFQRADADGILLQYYHCTVDFASKTLRFNIPSDSSKAVATCFKSETVLPSVKKALNNRFRLDISDVQLIFGHKFTVLYQDKPGKLGSPGIHIFTVPYVFDSTIIHLWYKTTNSAPFIDEQSGTCLGIYGQVKPPPTEPPDPHQMKSPSPTPVNQPLQIRTGQLGTPLNLVINSVEYGGTTPVYLEARLSKSADGVATFGIREWTRYDQDFVKPSDGRDKVSRDTRQVTLSPLDTSPVALDLHWESTLPIQEEINPQPQSDCQSSELDTSLMKDGDLWLFEIIPWDVDSIESGLPNKGKATLIVDTSGSHLPLQPEFSCSYTLTYHKSADGNDRGSIKVTNSTSDIVKNTTYALSNTWQVTISPATANLVVTLGGEPQDQDKWEMVIKSGLVQTPKSGISNSGPWGYPTISGSYLPSKACTVKVSCLSITPSKKDPEKIKFNYSIDGNPPSDFTLTAKIDTITKGQKDEKDRGKDIKKITGWSTETLNNGLTFTFENMDGTPAVGDSWTLNVRPSTAALEVFAQAPTASISSSLDSALVLTPTRSAGGRLMQLKIPLQEPPVAPFTPNGLISSSLLPLRTTLEPRISGDTLTFKGVKSAGASWSASIKAEISTDDINQRMYGLQRTLGQDYREAHSGVFYTVKVDDNGVMDQVSTFSSFDDADRITEPKMEKKYLDELPPLGYVQPKGDRFKYKPTVWFSVFPQYRFFIGQVQAIADISRHFALDVANTSVSLKPAVLKGTGRTLLNEEFFVNCSIPAADIEAFRAWKAKATEDTYGPVRDKFLKDKNPLDDEDFLKCAWNPDSASVDDTVKYIIQLMVLHDMWTSPPGWKVETTEGRRVDNYWKFRIDGHTVEQFLETAYNHPSFVNKKNEIDKRILPDFFSTDKLFSEAFGSPTTCTACVLTDPRMEASFTQLNGKNRFKLYSSMLQMISAGGAELSRAAYSYLTTSAVFQSLRPMNRNIVSDVPILAAPKMSEKDADKAWITKHAGPAMTLAIIAQQIVGLASILLLESNLQEIIQNVHFTSTTQLRAYEIGDRVNLRPRSYSVPARTGEAVVQQGRTIVIPQEVAVNGFVYQLPPDIAKKLPSEKLAVFSGGIGTLLTSLVTFFMITDTIAACRSAEGWDWALVSVSIGTDVLMVGHSIVSGLSVYKQVNLIRALKAGDVALAGQLYDGIGKLEIYNKYLCGLVNIFFGIHMIGEGVKGVKKGGSHVGGAVFDLTAGGFMAVGGTLELVGMCPQSGIIGSIGGIFVGIAIEISIIKIWWAGDKEIAGQGQGLINLFNCILSDNFKIYGGMEESDIAQNFIIHIKKLALSCQVSKKVDKSPDPRDGGAEQSKLIIAPFHSVRDIKDKDD